MLSQGHTQEWAHKQSKKQTNEAFMKQTTWLRPRRVENQVWTPWVIKWCVKSCQGCVVKDVVCMVLGSISPPEEVCLGMHQHYCSLPYDDCLLSTLAGEVGAGSSLGSTVLFFLKLNFFSVHWAVLFYIQLFSLSHKEICERVNKNC